LNLSRSKSLLSIVFIALHCSRLTKSHFWFFFWFLMLKLLRILTAFVEHFIHNIYFQTLIKTFLVSFWLINRLVNLWVCFISFIDCIIHFLVKFDFQLISNNISFVDLFPNLCNFFRWNWRLVWSLIQLC
jgi:hypothetical protein